MESREWVSQPRGVERKEFGVFLAGHWMDHSKSAGQLYDELVEQAVFADELGYDQIWIAEHYIVDYIAVPGPFQLALLIAERTERIRVGIAVIILRNYHPIKLAAQIAMIDVLSKQRFVAALGRGASGHELHQMELEMSQEESREYYHEHVLAMSKLWHSRQSIAHDGHYFKFDNSCIMPPPLSEQPPFYLVGLSPRSIRMSVSNCKEAGIPPNIICSPFREPFSHVESCHQAFADALTEFGYSRNEGRFAINRSTYVADTDEQAYEVMPSVYDMHRGLVRMLSNTEIIKDGIMHYDPVDDEPSEQEIFDNCVFGSPATVTEKIRGYQALGLNHFSAYMNMGQSHEMVMGSLERFAKEVMPAFVEI